MVGPEQGLTLPGLSIVCGDSHTSTHGAFGAYACGIGASEVAHVLMTQTLWQRKPKRMRITVDGQTMCGIGAKDIALAIIAKIGAAVRRATPLNLPAPRSALCPWKDALRSATCASRRAAVAAWWRRMRRPSPISMGAPMRQKETPSIAPSRTGRRFVSDGDADFDRDVALDAAGIAPIVTWGTNPEEALPIDARVPDPARETNPDRARHLREVLDYMGIAPAARLTEIAIDRVFIGSCTNARIEDLARCSSGDGRPSQQGPRTGLAGSSLVKVQAEQEGLDRIFRDAGLEWGESGCSMCAAMNGDIVPPQERCASTTNRNFRGRQGPGARTHLMSPAMVAAAAVTGHLTDVRRLHGGPKEIGAARWKNSSV